MKGANVGVCSGARERHAKSGDAHRWLHLRYRCRSLRHSTTLMSRLRNESGMYVIGGRVDNGMARTIRICEYIGGRRGLRGHIWRLLAERDGMPGDIGTVPFHGFADVDPDSRPQEAHQRDGLNTACSGNDFPGAHDDLVLMQEAFFSILARIVVRVLVREQRMPLVRRLLIVEVLIVGKSFGER